MINSRYEIISLLEEYMVTQQECSNQLFLPETTKWNTKRKVFYTNGIVLGKFQENDAETLRVLKEGVSDQALYNEIRINLECNIKLIEKLDQIDIPHQRQLESYKKQQDELPCDLIDNWITKNCGWIREYVMNIPYSEIRVLLYLYYSFDNYNHQRTDAFCSDLNELEAVYKSLFDKQSQFSKYGIVPIDDERELLPINPPRIYDKIINKTFFTKNVPSNLVKTISSMLSIGIVKEFSVRLFNEPGYNGKLIHQSVEEELERGKIFDFVNLGNYSISRLYSKEYEDCMWIVIDPQNITFEELCKDFEVYNDMVVTQVVHLRYEKEDDYVYITHLDHEYVFYTIDEYENRMNNTTQKGTAKTRMKSFKIDNSKIPFDYRCEVLRKDDNGNNLPRKDEQFLCYVLECYFAHKDLLKEYFQEILK